MNQSQKMSKSAAVLTVGVDFGTTYSGYAYSFAGSNGQILINTNWSANSGLSTYKAPTSILTRYDSSTDKHTFLKFGFSALDEYVRHSQDGSYCLFDTFKMKLYKIEEQVSLSLNILDVGYIRGKGQVDKG